MKTQCRFLERTLYILPSVVVVNVTYRNVISQMSWGRILNTATRRSAMERWYINLYIRDIGLRRNCLTKATNTNELETKASTKITH